MQKRYVMFPIVKKCCYEELSCRISIYISAKNSKEHVTVYEKMGQPA